MGTWKNSDIETPFGGYAYFMSATKLGSSAPLDDTPMRCAVDLSEMKPEDEQVMTAAVT